MSLLKKSIIALSINLALVSSVLACTTLLAGSEATNDGSLIIARSADSDALKAQHFVIHPAKSNQTGNYSTKEHNGANNFTYPLPENALRYTTVPNWKTQLHGATGFNELGVGVSGTESIFASPKALSFDPYVEDTGITEDDIPDVLLSRAKTAREAIEVLGSIIETQGAGEGFGVAVVDKNELWYLETGTGHHWIAQKLPKDKYFATGNQGRLQTYDINSKDVLGSKNLVEFAVEKGLYNPEKEGTFNFSKAYTRDDERDRTYNDPRVWIIQQQFNPSLKQAVDDGRNFAPLLTPEKKVSIEEAKAMLRNHFEGTEHDPYTNGLKAYPQHYGIGTNKADNDSIYWKYRKLQTLVMTDYPKLAPIVKKAYQEWEEKTALEQKEMEAKYLAMIKTDKMSADKMLNEFNLGVMASAEKLTENLTNELFTLKTKDIQDNIFFANKSKKD